MANEKLTAYFCNIMKAKIYQYRYRLKNQPPSEILSHIYEYMMSVNIVDAMKDI